MPAVSTEILPNLRKSAQKAVSSGEKSPIKLPFRMKKDGALCCARPFLVIYGCSVWNQSSKRIVRVIPSCAAMVFGNIA